MWTNALSPQAVLTEGAVGGGQRPFTPSVGRLPPPGGCAPPALVLAQKGNGCASPTCIMSDHSPAAPRGGLRSPRENKHSSLRVHQEAWRCWEPAALVRAVTWPSAPTPASAAPLASPHFPRHTSSPLTSCLIHWRNAARSLLVATSLSTMGKHLCLVSRDAVRVLRAQVHIECLPDGARTS